MKTYYTERKSTKCLNRAALWTTYAAVLLIGLAAYLVLEKVTAISELKRQEQDVQHHLADVQSLLRVRLDAYVTMTENLAELVEFDGGEPGARFAEFSEILTRNSASILNIALAEGYVITQVFPFEPNQAALGLDFRTRTDQLPDVDYVLATRKTIVAGPTNLVQGGTGLIVRAASKHSPDTFYSVVLDFRALFSEIGIRPISGDALIAVRSKPSGDVAGETVVGAADVWTRKPVVGEIRLGRNNVLEIGIAPRSGWITASPYRAEIALVVIVLALISIRAVNYARGIIVDRAVARRQLLATIESVEDGFVVYDENDNLLLCNQKYKSYYRESADLLVPGTSFSHIIREGVARGQYPEAAGREEEWIEERLANHANPSDPIEQQLANGRWLKVAESKTVDNYTVGFRVDITELKLALMRAEAASAAKTDFLNNISHEFRTPLSIVLGYVAFLRNVAILPKFKELSEAVGDVQPIRAKLDAFAQEIVSQAEKTDRSGQHLMGLINSVLDWSTLSGGHVELSVAELDLNKLLDSLCDEMADSAQKKGLQLIYSGQECIVDGDELRLRQVFINLISNAIKFTDKGYVRVELDQSEDSVVVGVEDTGIGIPRDRRTTIFERFAQADSSTKRKYGGAGLGLAISKNLVELHHGDVILESSEGAGSKFTVTLPKLRNYAVQVTADAA